MLNKGVDFFAEGITLGKELILVLMELPDVVKLYHGLLETRLDRAGGIPHVMNDHVQEKLALM